MRKICIDCGHGGTDSGAVGINIKEKDYTLFIGRRVKEILKDYHCEVIMTRYNDTYVSLSDRSTISNNNKCDAFISIHCNHVDDVTANGFESFSYYGSTPLQKTIHEYFVEYTPLKDRKMKKANFHVLRKTKANAVLLELGFISNYADSKYLNEYKEHIAHTIAGGIVKHYRIAKK